MPFPDFYSRRLNIDDVLTGARFALAPATRNVGTPIPGIGSAAVALIALIDKIKETGSNHKDREAVLRELSFLVDAINRMSEEITTSDPRRDALIDGLEGSAALDNHAIMRIFSELQQLKVKADMLYQGSRGLHWMRKSWDATTLKEVREGIAKCRKDLELECQVSLKASIKMMKEGVMQEAVNNANDKDEETLQSLPHADASYHAAVNAVKSNYVQGTRAELLKKMNDWIELRSEGLLNKAVCILTGGAGTGKSTIASELARMRHVKGDCGASFFFVRGEADLDSIRLVFPTLAYQLAQSQDALRPHIIRAARAHLTRGRLQQMKFQARDLLHRPIRDVGREHPPIVLVIDALDECAEEARDLVLEMLDRLMDSICEARFPLRIFLTSRPNPLIENTLQRSEWSSLVRTISLHDFSSESIRRDIKAFVCDKIARLPYGQALLQGRPRISEDLAKRAGGLFIYAKTAMDFLGDYPGFVEDGLDVFPAEDSSSPAIVLKPLDHLYLTVLETAFPPKNLLRAPQLRQALESTLGSLAVLHNPLSPTVLEELTGVPRRDICNVLSRLRAVMLFDEKKPDEKVRAMHTTFPQFLVDPNRCMSPWYRVDARHQHACLAAGCLRALLALRKNMCRLPDAAVARADVPYLAERLGAYVPEHVQYACAYWAAHLGGACELGKEHIRTVCGCREIGERLAAFARTRLGAWVEMMAYMGRVDMVEEALGAARAYLKGAPQYQGVESLLARAQQLVVDHYFEIEECPYYVHESFKFSSSTSEPAFDGNETASEYYSFVEDGLDEFISEGSSQFDAMLQSLDDLAIPGTPFPLKGLSQSSSSDKAPADAASHTQRPCGPQEPSSISGSGAGPAGTPQYVPYSMGRYWQISETHRFAYTLESANYGFYRQTSSESE